MPVKFTRAERVSLRLHPELSEKWVEDLIAADPSILGLGDLILIGKQRIQPRAGRLDLLLQDSEKRRYEVEIQLGATDEAHVIRSIEYYDIERKRYPQYDHCAVIVAEDITARFLNVISLFNGSVPLLALQMQAFKMAEHLTLIFTRVLDELTRGLVDQDEEAETATGNDAKAVVHNLDRDAVFNCDSARVFHFWDRITVPTACCHLDAETRVSRDRNTGR